MYCFIGGSGSTGSSVLANVLNRHSQVMCGPETYLFTKHQIFEDWDFAKRQMIEGTLRSFPWHQYAGTDLLHPYYEWAPKKLKELIYYSKDISEFSEEFFGHKRRNARKHFWAEKTPSNVFGFQYLKEHFPGCYLIHIVRNPYDTIASLNRRGFSIYYATCLYLLNTAVGLSMSSYDNYIQVAYEDFVTDPEEELLRICIKLGIRYEDTMLKEAVEVFNADIPSWKQSESSEISSKSIGGFDELSRLVRHEIVYSVNSLMISKYYKNKYKLVFQDIPSICSHLGYQHFDDDGLYNIFQLQIDKTRDHLMRILKGYPNTFSKYPIVIWKQN